MIQCRWVGLCVVRDHPSKDALSTGRVQQGVVVAPNREPALIVKLQRGQAHQRWVISGDARISQFVYADLHSVIRQPAQVFILNLQAGAVGTQPHRLIAVTPGEVAAQIRHAVHRCLPRRLPARQVQCAIDMQQTLLDAYTRLPRAERMQQHALL